MLNIESVNHVGIRVADKGRSTSFYQNLGCELLQDAGFDQGHPLVMLHASGININLRGPATARPGENILMDEKPKYPGITHLAVKVKNAEATETFVNENAIAITGRREFRGTKTIFIRDPDRNVLELVGPGPSVADLIAEHVHEANE